MNCNPPGAPEPASDALQPEGKEYRDEETEASYKRSSGTSGGDQGTDSWKHEKERIRELGLDDGEDHVREFEQIMEIEIHTGKRGWVK